MEFKGTKKAEEYAKEKSSSSIFAEAHKKDFLVGYKQALKDSKAPEMLEMLERALQFINYEDNFIFYNEIEQLIKEAIEL